MIKLALIGKDVSQSTSPVIHNFIAKRMGKQITYDKISIDPANFEDRIEEILATYDGFNVTIPFKLSVIPYLEILEDDAYVFGSVNTVLSASRTGFNTDGMGFKQTLEAEGISVRGKKVLLLGAGGAGRSIAKTIIDAGGDLEIFDSNTEAAQKVAAEFGAVAVPEVAAEPRKLIINATGVGMHKTVGLSPVGEDVLKLTDVALDLIYVPEKSAFLCIAEELGKKIINGKSMLFYQAYYSDCYYFGITPNSSSATNLYKEYLDYLKEIEE